MTKVAFCWLFDTFSIFYRRQLVSTTTVQMSLQLWKKVVARSNGWPGLGTLKTSREELFSWKGDVCVWPENILHLEANFRRMRQPLKTAVRFASTARKLGLEWKCCNVATHFVTCAFNAGCMKTTHVLCVDELAPIIIKKLFFFIQLLIWTVFW